MQILTRDIETRIQQDIIANALHHKYSLATIHVAEVLKELYDNIPENKRVSFSYAAYAISQLKVPLSTMKNKLREIKGVGEKTEKIILEILETKNSAYYNSLQF